MFVRDKNVKSVTYRSSDAEETDSCVKHHYFRGNTKIPRRNRDPEQEQIELSEL